MTLFDALSLIGGLSLFLFGMNLMGNALEKKAGGTLNTALSKITDSPIRGFLLGMLVTAVIQSSSATTVMVVGFVNSGIMTLKNAISIIMGANIGTTVTSWILSLSGISGSNVFVKLLKPSSFVPILALAGIILYMFCKSSKKKDTGFILLGFATLMTGMEAMSSAVSGLRDVPEFTSILTLFSNPLLGIAAGAVLTAVIQSSSASVGILQALSSTGTITYGSAIPIIMGQNIGTCVTAMISSLGANKNAKRAAFVHLYFNVFGSLILCGIFYGLNSVINFAFADYPIDEFGIAVVHTIFNVACTLVWAPFTSVLEKIATLTVKDSEEKEKYEMLDERLLATPAVAVERCRIVTETMAEIATECFRRSLRLLERYDQEDYDFVIKAEKKTDKYEDILGSYLVKVSALELSQQDSTEAAKLLHIIGDFERISDHAVSILKSAEEMGGKKIGFSGTAGKELKVMVDAVIEIMELALKSFCENDKEAIKCVEPLEQVVDDLKAELKGQHIRRLTKGECTIEQGFVFGDIITNLERVADHCSNIAGCVTEMAHSEMDMHSYVKKVKKENISHYNERYEEYKLKYSL